MNKIRKKISHIWYGNILSSNEKEVLSIDKYIPVFTFILRYDTANRLNDAHCIQILIEWLFNESILIISRGNETSWFNSILDRDSLEFPRPSNEWRPRESLNVDIRQSSSPLMDLLSRCQIKTDCSLETPTLPNRSKPSLCPRTIQTVFCRWKIVNIALIMTPIFYILSFIDIEIIFCRNVGLSTTQRLISGTAELLNC